MRPRSMLMPYSLELLPRASRRMWGLTVLILGVGTAAIVGSHLMSHGIVSEALRDLGIAFVIASLVTVIYESYVRERFATETVSDLLERVVGDMVDGEVWRELREQLLEKTTIRREATVSISLDRYPGMAEDQMVLWMSYSYQITSLRSYGHRASIVHFLDPGMRDTHLGLPRFKHIAINGDAVLPLPTDRFEQEVQLEGKDGRGINVAVEREELVRMPGDYVFVMSDLTHVDAIVLRGCPEGISVSVDWVHGNAVLDQQRALRLTRYLLRGQVFVFRFYRTEKEGSGSSAQLLQSRVQSLAPLA